MPTLPLPNLRARPHTARVESMQRRDPNLPVGGVDFRTGEPVLPREYTKKKFRAPLTARIRTRGASNPAEARAERGSPEKARDAVHLRPRIDDAGLRDSPFYARSPSLLPCPCSVPVVLARCAQPASAYSSDRMRRRLDATLSEMKKKHEMPVKGWRAVAAVHNAKNEVFRHSYKERMEEVEPRWQFAAYSLLIPQAR